MKKANQMFTTIGARKKAKIEGALRLINADLKSIGPKEVMELATTLRNTFGVFNAQFLALAEYHGEPQKLRWVYRELQGELHKLQTTLKNFFDNMMATVSNHKNSEEERRLVEEEHYPSPPIGHCSVALDIDLRLEHEVDPSDLDDEYGFLIRLHDPWPLGPKERYRIKIRSKCQQSEMQSLYDFIMALEDVPISSFCQCEECKGWFLHVTNKKRLFCSSRCRARKGSRASYSKIKASNPKKYEDVKTKGKERAEKSYDRRTRRKSGVRVLIGKEKKSKKED
ncbi:MAG: hypothetical protein ACLP5H_04975 [Desulfomonilaceae bacterium]